MNEHLHLRIGVWCLIFVGFWPLKLKTNIYNILYTAYFRVTLSIYVLFVTTQFMEMFKLLGEGLEAISDFLGVHLLYTLCLVKVWVVGGDRIKKLTNKILVTEKNILKSKNREMISIYMEQVKEIHLANKTWTILAVSCYVLFGSAPIFTELADPPSALFDIVDNTTIVYRKRPLPLISWFPFDRYKYFKTAYCWHLIAMCMATAYLTACNNFLYGLITFAIGQIKILQFNLLTINKNGNKSGKELFDELRKCIMYHKAIILYVEELSKAMKTFLLMDFVACALQMAVIGFRVAVMDVSFQMLKVIVYLVTMLLQLFLFYWYGNEIILESVEVAKAIWECGWYSFDSKVKFILLIIIIRARKPLTLSVGPFYKMSTDTMTTILRAGYSYAAIMRRFYRKH